jgi:hypothetical protein
VGKNKKSELSIDVGGVGDRVRQWPGARAFRAKIEGATAWQIPVAEWPSFCEWFTQNFKGIEAGMERKQATGDHVVEFPNRPLAGMHARLLANGVGAIAVTVAANTRERVFELTGVKTIRLDIDAAGWPKELQLGCEAEQVVFRFTGSVKRLRSLPETAGASDFNFL